MRVPDLITHCVFRLVSSTCGRIGAEWSEVIPGRAMRPYCRVNPDFLGRNRDLKTPLQHVIPINAEETSEATHERSE